MLDLRAEATATWLTENGSEDIARLLRRKCIDEPPELAAGIDAFGHALDASIAGGADLLDHALHDGMAVELAQVMAYTDGGRRLRLLHWLTSAGFEQPHEIIYLLTTPTTPSGHALLRWIAALLRREQLDRLFSLERIQTLEAACRKAEQTELSR
jgi:hypothetical protein